MPYVDCPKCGASKAAYEDANTTTFCGKCEEEYQRSVLVHQATPDHECPNCHNGTIDGNFCCAGECGVDFKSF